MGRNLEVENKAIKFVMNYEEENNPEDCHNKSVGYDIKCLNKIIEVKGSTEKSLPFVVLNSSNMKALKEKENFFIYVVYNLNENPRLMIIDRVYIEKNKKEKISLEIPLRKEQHNNSIEL